MSGQSRRAVNVVKLMKLIFEDSSAQDDEIQRQQEVFVYYHDDDRQWVVNVLIVFIGDELGMSLKTEDDFAVGEYWIESLFGIINLCAFTLLVLSTSYVLDSRCRHVTVTAYTLRPQSVVPIGLNDVTRESLAHDSLYWGLVQTNGLIQWYHDEERQQVFWSELTQRLRLHKVEYDCTEDIIVDRNVPNSYSDVGASSFQRKKADKPCGVTMTSFFVIIIICYLFVQ